jgi:hypothetical protein
MEAIPPLSNRIHEHLIAVIHNIGGRIIVKSRFFSKNWKIFLFLNKLTRFLCKNRLPKGWKAVVYKSYPQ